MPAPVNSGASLVKGAGSFSFFGRFKYSLLTFPGASTAGQKRRQHRLSGFVLWQHSLWHAIHRSPLGSLSLSPSPASSHRGRLWECLRQR